MTFDVALVMRKHGGNPAAITAEGMLFDKKRCQSAFLRVVKSLTLHIIIEGKSEKFNNDFRGEGDGNPQVQNARCPLPAHHVPKQQATGLVKTCTTSKLIN